MKRGHRLWQRRLWGVLAPAAAVLLVLALLLARGASAAEQRPSGNPPGPAVAAPVATAGGR